MSADPLARVNAALLAERYGTSDTAVRKHSHSSARPRPFILLRHHDPSGVSGVGVVAEGIVWSDSTVDLRWLGDTPSTSVWQNVETMLAVHGHQGATELIFIDRRRR